MKVILALDPAAPNNDAFAAVQALTRGEPDVEVCGVFIEDSDLLRYSSLPIACEVGLASGAIGDFSVAQLESQFRARATRIRATFELGVRDMATHDAHWTATFNVRRGAVVDELRATAEAADLLVISHCRASAGQRTWFGATVADLLAAPPCSLLFVQEPWHSGECTLVASINAAHADVAATRLASQLARNEQLRLHELDYRSSELTANEAFGVEPLLDTENLIRSCLRLHARVLVLADSPVLREQVDLVQLIDRVPASLLLVRL